MVGTPTMKQAAAPVDSATCGHSTPSYADLTLSNRHELFCSQAWYQKVLQHHLTKLTINPNDFYLDVGSGTGRGTQLIAERLKPGGMIIGIEPSEGLVRCASKNAERNDLVKYRVGRAEDITALHFNREVSGVISFNTVHLLSSREEFYRDARSLLKSGGTLSFCTGYHSRGMSDDDRVNVLEALFNAYTKGLQMVRAFGQHSMKNPTVPSARPQNLELSTTECELTRAGFNSVTLDLQPITVPASSFAEFLTLPGSSFLPASIPLDEQKELILDALQKRDIIEVSRYWLHVYAE